MTFSNDKKTFLEKIDKSKKGGIDVKVARLIEIINKKENYYTTSSCSGRAYLWTGTGRKNETQWLKISHDLIDENFFILETTEKMVWLRVEPLILHVACQDLVAANILLEIAKKIYKKSCILSASNKVMVEIRGSEFLEMPLYDGNKLLFCGDLLWLSKVVNEVLTKIWKKMGKFEGVMAKL